MKKIIFLYLLSFFFSGSDSTAQNYSIQINVPDHQGDRAYLALLYGDEIILKDSAVVIDGNIYFSLTEDAQVGMYRVFITNPSHTDIGNPKPVYTDLIFNRENITLMTSYNTAFNDVVVKQSEENRKYYDFLKLRSNYRKRMSRLLPLTEVYDSTDDFYHFLSKELLRIQMNYNDSLIQMTNKEPEMLASSIISLNSEPVYDPRKSGDLNLFMRENFLKPISFNDERLIHTKAITQKIISYLSFFRQQDSDMHSQHEAYIDAVDIIMGEVLYNEAIYDFVLNYLIDGFEQFQMESVLVHIADNYLTGECKTESEEIIKERLEAYKKMAPGNKVPDINLLDPFDIPQRLSALDNERILLVFWSSECPHCVKLLPRLSKWVKEENEVMDLSMYTVSIDKSRADWEEFILINEMDNVNVFDPEGWESKTARRYNLYATPTMFLLDNNLKILAKPLSFREFKQGLDVNYE